MPQETLNKTFADMIKLGLYGIMLAGIAVCLCAALVCFLKFMSSDDLQLRHRYAKMAVSFLLLSAAVLAVSGIVYMIESLLL